MKTILKGTSVRQIVPVITGTTVQARLNDEQNEIEYLVSFVDDAGHPAERWFLASQIEVTASATI